MREKSETNTFLFIRMFFSSFSFSQLSGPATFCVRWRSCGGFGQLLYRTPGHQYFHLLFYVFYLNIIWSENVLKEAAAC